MILRLDKLVLDLPKPTNPSANDAAAVRELLGGKFDEMSTLMNYTFQSFNFQGRDFRGRDRLRPFYSLTAAIAAEEYSHIEAVSYAINPLLTGTSKHNPDPVTGPLAGAVDARNTHHFIASGQAALPMDSMGRPWTGDNVFSSDNLRLDLPHTFSPNAYMEAGLIWNGKHPEDGSELQVIQGAKKGVPYPVLEEEPQLNSPGEDNFDPEMFGDTAKKLGLAKKLAGYRPK